MRRFLGPVLTATGALRARWSVVIVLVPSLLIGVLGLLFTSRVQGEFNCQAKYNTAFQQRSAALQDVAAQDRLNTAAMVRAVATARTRTAAAKALADYLATADRLERERQQHPFPTLPEQACT
jgi:hypothetical protein